MDHLPGCGPTTAFDIVRKYGSVARALSCGGLAKHKPPDGWGEAAASAITLFEEPSVVTPASQDVKGQTPDLERLKEFLVDRHNFNAEYVCPNRLSHGPHSFRLPWIIPMLPTSSCVLAANSPRLVVLYGLAHVFANVLQLVAPFQSRGASAAADPRQQVPAKHPTTRCLLFQSSALRRQRVFEQ